MASDTKPTLGFPLNQCIGFIGAGTMAQIIGKQLLNNGIAKPQLTYACAPSDKNLSVWMNWGCFATNSPDDVITNCDTIFLAMKPQQLDNALANIDCVTYETKIVISLLVGVSLKTLRKKIAEALKCFHLVRVMPNMPIEVGQGCSVMCSDLRTPADIIMFVKQLMSCGGVCEEIPEAFMNTAGAITASGPAFIYTIVHALSDAAVRQGLPSDTAQRLICHMIQGSAKMVLQTGKHPAALRDNVCSPAGSTIYGIEALETSGLRTSLMKGLNATIERSKEIGNAMMDRRPEPNVRNV